MDKVGNRILRNPAYMHRNKCHYLLQPIRGTAMNKEDLELAHLVLWHAKILLDHGAANTVAKELEGSVLPYSKAFGTAVTLLEQNGATPPPKSVRDALEKPCESEFRNRHTEDSQSNPRSH